MIKPIKILGFESELDLPLAEGYTFAWVMYGIRKIEVGCNLLTVEGEGYFLDDVSMPFFITFDNRKVIIKELSKKLDEINAGLREALGESKKNWWYEEQEARGL